MAPHGDPQLEGDAPCSQQGVERLSWQQAAGALAGAVGSAAWVSAVGSAIVGLRLEQSDLPVESAVALMSAEHRFVIGAGFLIAPVFVGFVAFIGEWAILVRRPEITDFWRLVLAAAAIIFATALGVVILRLPWPPTLFLAQCAGALVAVLGSFIALGRVHAHRNKLSQQGPILGRPHEMRHRLDEFVIVTLAVLISAGTISLIGVALDSPEFDTAALDLADGGRIDDAMYVTTTAEAVVLITRRGDGCWGIGAVPRVQIVRIRIGPDTRKVSMAAVCTR